MKSQRDNLMVTEPLYETDGMLRNFDATVISSSEHENKGYAVVLDRTAFFPGGGGQESDNGKIGEFKVLEVTKEDGQIVHYIDGNIEPGTKVKCEVDFGRRADDMRAHGAEHLVCGIIHSKFGYENVGFHVSGGEAVFDVDGPLTNDDVAEIEKLANQAVLRNLPITISYPTPDEASNISYRSKLETTENIRLVTIEGIDVCACCAPMVHSTAEFGLIKIISSESHRGGTRLILIAGGTAYDDYAKLDCNNQMIREITSAKRYETAAKVKELNDKCQKIHEENIRLKKEITDILAEKYVQLVKAKTENDSEPVIIFSESLDNVQLRNLINACTAAGECLVAGFIGNDENGYKYILASTSNYKYENVSCLKEYAASFNETLGGRGGGNNEMISGSISASRKEIEKYLKK